MKFLLLRGLNVRLAKTDRESSSPSCTCKAPSSTSDRTRAAIPVAKPLTSLRGASKEHKELQSCGAAAIPCLVSNFANEEIATAHEVSFTSGSKRVPRKDGQGKLVTLVYL